MTKCSVGSQYDRVHKRAKSDTWSAHSYTAFAEVVHKPTDRVAEADLCQCEEGLEEEGE